jgi:hypothetical protein
MKRTILPLLLSLALLPALQCGSGKKVEPDFQYLTDLMEDQPNLPEVPNHVFDLVQDAPADTITILPDGKVVEVDEEVVEVIDVVLPDDKGGDDGSCKPQCTLEDGSPKECGPDQCGSICGYCGYDEICVEGICKEYCEPKCAGKTCGPDGCYGTCPPGCDEDEVCGEDQLCYPFCDHDKNCEGKQCGPDGCGGSCGQCGLGLICNAETAQCDPHPCGDIPAKGKCTDDNVLLECIDDQPVETACQSLGEDYYCKWDGPNQKFVCAQGCVPTCVFPDGTPKECGYDGCYGVCGNCTDGWTCEAGSCYPVAGAACGWITTKGNCIENQLWFCNGGKLYVDDCPANGMTCGFDINTGTFKCK